MATDAKLDETTAYRTQTAVSRGLHERAVKVMPGGNSRHSVILDPYPVYVKSGKGCRVVDVEGEERIDFLNNYTSAILGHADPKVRAAVHEHLDAGTVFSMPTEHDVKLAELLVSRVPYIDQLRFCNSGSEAVMLAIKAARAFKGRSKIAKFEGAYHGIYDYAAVSEGVGPDAWGDPDEPASAVEPGTPPSVRDDVIVLPWNRLEVCERLLDKHKAELAAVLVDPLPAAVGFIAPRPGFLEGLFDLTRVLDILYVSDEVMSFRLAYHGACHAHGIDPDLTSFGKMVGGGFPVGAVAGKAEVMAVFDHTKGIQVHHGGTFNANPITMVAGYATMEQMTPEAFDRLDRLGGCIREKIGTMMESNGIKAQVAGRGSIFFAHLTDTELVDYRGFASYHAALETRYIDLCHELLANGIVSSTRGILGCLSTPMTETELDAYVDALDRSLHVMSA